MTHRTIVALALALVLPLAGATAQQRAPGASWASATPREVGVNAAVLDSIDAEIRSGRYGLVDRMLVIRHGRIVHDASFAHDYDAAYGDSARVRSPLTPHDLTGAYNYYNAWWHPTYRRGDLHTLQSVTKTITSIIIGVAVTRGQFPALDTPILTFFDSTVVANLDPRKRAITIRHLLTMTDGMDWNEGLPYTDPKNTTVAMEGTYDWVKFAMDQPMAREPGTAWNYNSGASQILAHIFRNATGLDIEEYAARHLFAPIGIDRWFWKRTPAGLVDTEGGLYLEARDLARLWYLVSQHGTWNGTRVIADDWIRTSVHPAVKVGNTGTAYGFKWWLYPHPLDAQQYVWSGSGFGGQFPMYFPKEDLIVVFNAWNILPGKGALPMRQLRERLARAVIAP